MSYESAKSRKFLARKTMLIYRIFSAFPQRSGRRSVVKACDPAIPGYSRAVTNASHWRRHQRHRSKVLSCPRGLDPGGPWKYVGGVMSICPSPQKCHILSFKTGVG